MSILISGMVMPEDDCTAFRSVTVWNQWVDGEIKMYAHDFYTNEFIGEVINVPPHGRLIDADALRRSMYHEAFETDSPMQKWDSGCWIRYKMFERLEGNAPTVIEAEGE